MQRIFQSFTTSLALMLLLQSPAVGATLVIKGSDTLGGKLVPQMAEAFKAKFDDSDEVLAIEIAAEGSATGIASVIDGAADIGMLSRELTSGELAEAEARGLALESIPVARDALVIIVNERNPLASISSEDLSAIFNGDVENWAALSNEPGQISVYSRNTSSGTYVSFRRLALQQRDYGENIQKMAGNEQIALEVANNTHAIGYVGLAYSSKPGIRALPVDGLLPTDEGYPLARPLYFLINQSGNQLSLRNEFIEFVLSPEGQALAKRIQFLPAVND